jgi:hypothetical protein
MDRRDGKDLASRREVDAGSTGAHVVAVEHAATGGHVVVVARAKSGVVVVVGEIRLVDPHNGVPVASIRQRLLRPMLVASIRQRLPRDGGDRWRDARRLALRSTLHRAFGRCCRCRCHQREVHLVRDTVGRRLALSWSSCSCWCCCY